MSNRTDQPVETHSRRRRRSTLLVVAAAVAAFGVLAGCGGDDPVAVPEATPGNVVVIDDEQGAELIAGGDALVIDVRTTEEYTGGHLVGAQNINVEDRAIWSERTEPLDRDRPTIVYCRSGRRSAVAADLLVTAGFTEVYDLGGVEDWDPEVLGVES